jgi:hypothetical protein
MPQVLDAGVRQFGEWGNTDEGRHILIAVARYLAAHSPTERAELQTADIAGGSCAAVSFIRIRQPDIGRRCAVGRQLKPTVACVDRWVERAAAA